MSACKEGFLVEDDEPRLVQVSLEIIGRDGKGERVGYDVLSSNPSQVPHLKPTMNSPIGEPMQCMPDVNTLGTAFLSPWSLPLGK